MLNSLSAGQRALFESEKQLQNNGLPFGRKDETEQSGAFVDMSLVFPASGLCVWSWESVFGCFGLSVAPSRIRAGCSSSAAHRLAGLMFNRTARSGKLNPAEISRTISDNDKYIY